MYYNEIRDYYERMDEKYNLQNAGIQYRNNNYEKKKQTNNSLANDIAIGLKKSTPDVVNTKPIIMPYSFNKSQYQAVKLVLNNQVSIIQGPPGTGKTQAILNILTNIVYNGKTVAVVSNNNDAVDNIIEKCSEDPLKNLIWRMGSKEKKYKDVEDIYNCEEPFNYEDLEEIRTENIQESTDNILDYFDLQEQLANVRQNLLKMQHFGNYYSKEALDLKYDYSEFNRIFKFIKPKHNDIYRILNMDSTFKQHIKLLSRGIYGYSELLKNKNLILDKAKADYIDETIKKLNEQLDKIDKDIQKAKYVDKLEKITNDSQVIFKKYISGFRKAKDIDTRYNVSYKNSLPILLSTTAALQYNVDNNYKFDYIIFEEASQISTFSALHLLKFAHNIVCIGDLKQLSPIPFSNFSKFKDEEKFSNSPFRVRVGNEQNSILNTLSLKYSDENKIMLREHYRCHPDIINFCNIKYYDGKLIPMRKKDNEEDALNILKTDSSFEKNNSNALEVKEIENIINNQDISKDYYIVTPYSNQKDKLEEKELDSGTVHSSQGREYSSIYYSLVKDRPTSFNDQARLTNVSVSRAKDKFVIVTNDRLINRASLLDKNNKSKYGNLNDLITYIDFTSKNVYIEGKFKHVFSDFYNHRKKYPKGKSPPEEIFHDYLAIILKDHLSEYDFSRNVPLTDVINESIITGNDCFTKEEIEFINTDSHFDFIIFKKYDYIPLLVFEIDGKTHEEEIQIIRDRKKDSICRKLDLQIKRLKVSKEYIYDEVELLEFIKNALGR